MLSRTASADHSLHKGKTLFSLSGVSDGIQEKLAEFMGVTED